MITPTQQVKTPEQVKAKWRAHGQTMAGWAREHGFKPRDVELVINGFSKAKYGKGHTIAVALGIKAAPDDQQAA